MYLRTKRKITFSFSKVEQIKGQSFFQKRKSTSLQEALQAAVTVLLSGLYPGWMQQGKQISAELSRFAFPGDGLLPASEVPDIG